MREDNEVGTVTNNSYQQTHDENAFPHEQVTTFVHEYAITSKKQSQEEKTENLCQSPCQCKVAQIGRKGIA